MTSFSIGPGKCQWQNSLSNLSVSSEKVRYHWQRYQHNGKTPPSPRWSLPGPEISGPENDQIVWSLSGPGRCLVLLQAGYLIWLAWNSPNGHRSCCIPPQDGPHDSIEGNSKYQNFHTRKTNKSGTEHPKHCGRLGWAWRAPRICTQFFSFQNFHLVTLLTQRGKPTSTSLKLKAIACHILQSQQTENSPWTWSWCAVIE